MKILVIEDHTKIRENIVNYLTIKWYLAESANNGYEALKLLYTRYDAIILDINMPELDGKSFIKKIRHEHDETPILVITANTFLEDKLELFALGADDHLMKPFDMRELEARLISLIRRKNKPIETEITFWNCKIFLEKRIVFRDATEIELTSKEYNILEFLCRNKGFIKTKTDILEAVWGMNENSLEFHSITLEVHISSLRKKLWKTIIKTIKWSGYLIL